MRTTHWLVGCALCIVGIGSAAATNLDTQEQDSNAQHAAADNTSSRDAGNGGGDVLGLTRDTPSRSNGSSTSGNSNDHSGGSASSAPAPARQPHLGWQSLLPGSIQ